jgi:hypothetical protein
MRFLGIMRSRKRLQPSPVLATPGRAPSPDVRTSAAVTLTVVLGNLLGGRRRHLRLATLGTPDRER